MAIEMWQAVALTTALLAALIVVELADRKVPRAILKTAASLTFLAAGAALLPMGSAAGQLLFAGPVFRYWRCRAHPQGKKALFRSAWRLLATHSYSAAFLAHGIARRSRSGGRPLMVVAVLLGSGCSAVKDRCAPVATSSSPRWWRWLRAGRGASLRHGALLFYLSDLCVARERFVVKSKWNGIVGLPLYYAGQLMLIDGLR